MKPPIINKLFEKLHPFQNVDQHEYKRAEKERLPKDDVREGEILRTYQRREGGLFAVHDSYVHDKTPVLSGRALVCLVLNYHGDMAKINLHLDEDKFAYIDDTSVTPIGFFSDFNTSGQKPSFSASEFFEFQESLARDTELVGV